MSPSDLIAFIPRLQAQTFQGLTDDHLRAYLRVYTALYDMVVINALDDTYGDRDHYLQKIEALYIQLYQVNRTSPTVQNHLILLDIYDRYGTYSTVIAQRDPWEFAADYVEQCCYPNSDNPTPLHYPILQLIHHLWSGVELLDEEPTSLQYYHRTLCRWREQFPLGQGDSLPLSETLPRLILLITEQSDDELCHTLVHQVHQLLAPSNTSQNHTAEHQDLLLFLYDHLVQYPFAAYRSPLHDLVTHIEQQQETLSSESPYTFAFTALLFDHLCQQITADTQATHLDLHFA